MKKNINKLNWIQLNLRLFYKIYCIWKKSDKSSINMYYQPMDVMEEGIVIDPRSVGIPDIKNMLAPIAVNPLTKVTWLRDEQWRNALSPK